MRTLKPSGAVQTLYVVGMQHQRNLHYLRKGLVQVEGNFHVLDRRDGRFVDVVNEIAGDLKKFTMEVE